MEHDPLRHRHDAILRLVQGGQLCFESFVGERHGISVDRDLRPQFAIAQPVFVCCTVYKNGHQGLVARDWSYAAGKLQ